MDCRRCAASLVVVDQGERGAALEVLEIALSALSHGLACYHPDVGAPAHPDALHGPRQAHFLDVRQHLLDVPSEHFTVFPVVRLIAGKSNYRDDVCREFHRLGYHPVSTDGVHPDERYLARHPCLWVSGCLSFLAEVPHDLYLVDLVAPGGYVSEGKGGLPGGVVERDYVLAVFPASLVH